MFKKKIGLTNNDGKNKKLAKKIVLIALPVIIVIIAITLISTGGLSKLMGNSVVNKPEYIDPVIKGDFNLDGQVNWDDYYELARYNTAVLKGKDVSNYTVSQLMAGDIAYRDGIVYYEDQRVLREYLETGKSSVNGCYKADLNSRSCYVITDIGKKNCSYGYTFYSNLNKCKRNSSSNEKNTYKIKMRDGEYETDFDADIVLKNDLNYTSNGGSSYETTEGRWGSTRLDSTIDVLISPYMSFKYSYAKMPYLGNTDSNSDLGRYLCYEDNNKTMTGYVKEDICNKYGYVEFGLHEKVSRLYSFGTVEIHNRMILDKYGIQYYETSDNDDEISVYKPEYYQKNQSITIKDPVKKSDDSKFLGWKARKGGDYYCYTSQDRSNKNWVNSRNCATYGYVYFQPGDTVKDLAEPGVQVDFVSEWQEDWYQVHFSGNGASGHMSFITLKKSENKKLPKNTYNLTGSIFTGWQASLNVEGQYNETYWCYGNSQKTSIGWKNSDTCYQYGYALIKDQENISKSVPAKSTITLIAQWQMPFTVHYNANGGTGTMSDQKIPFGVSTPLKTNTFAKKDYVFVGWKAIRSDGKHYCYTNSSKTKSGWLSSSNCSGFGHCLYKDKQSVAKTAPAGSSVTMYAEWKSTKFTVRYNANGGTGTMSEQKVTYGVSTPLKTNAFTRKNYVFVGWKAIRSDGKHYCYTNSSKTKSGWLSSSNCSGFGHCLYKDKQSVAKTAPGGSTVTMYAEWDPTRVNATPKYYCANGYEKVGDGPTSYCQKITYKYTCPKGYEKVGYESRAYCRKVKRIEYYCGNGEKMIGTGEKAYCQQQSYKYTCPAGYTKIADGPSASCKKKIGVRYTCKSGWKKYGSGKNTICKTEGSISYTCPKGYTKRGDGPSAVCFKGSTKNKNYQQTKIQKTQNYLSEKATAKDVYDTKKVSVSTSTVKLDIKKKYYYDEISVTKDRITKRYNISVEYICPDNYKLVTVKNGSKKEYKCERK